MTEQPERRENDPWLREPKPPFGLRADLWKRIRWTSFGIACLAICVAILYLITKPPPYGNVPTPTFNGEEMPTHYQTVNTVEGCDEEQTVVDPAPYFVLHPGLPHQGPIFRGCGSNAGCEEARLSDIAIGPPSIPVPRGEVSYEPRWADWLASPTVLEQKDDGSRGGLSWRVWEDEAGRHRIERIAALRLVDRQFELSTEIRVGLGPADAPTDSVPEMRCVARRTIRLRAIRR